MKKLSFLMIMTLVLGLTACGKADEKVEKKDEVVTEVKDDAAADAEVVVEQPETEGVKIELSNSSILVDGEEISEDPESAVYKANDIIFYLEGQGMTYGEGTEADEHSQIEADAHTVVHITEPGTYEVSGTLEAGQIFVDLGEDAEDDPNAVVNLVLNNADITCLVAPAIFFYNVYECAEVTDEEHAVMDVDTSAAGANIVLADGSKNKAYGSYVARIYESYELNEEGTEVIDSKKLHKYDGAVYSKMSMNVWGDTGSLDITAENEGLGTEMHLTMFGGNVSIKSGNDGINVSEDNVSVFHMKGGSVDIAVTGETGEGDGIDSNGWLVISGGTVTSAACGTSMDAGIDADKGIYINGGTVTATGNMPAEIAEGNQACITLSGRNRLEGGKTYEVKDAEENVVLEVKPANAFTSMVISSEAVTAEGAYTLWLDNEQVADGTGSGMFGPGMGGGRPGGEMPEGFDPSQMPEGFNPGEMPEGFDPGQMPEGFNPGEMPEGFDPSQMPEGFDGERPGRRPEGVEIPNVENPSDEKVDL